MQDAPQAECRPSPLHLIQLLVPRPEASTESGSRELFGQVRTELLAQFGGVTAFVQSPAIGLWTEPRGETVRDEIVVFEVMADSVDEAWWAAYRALLEKRFDQLDLVIRCHAVRRL